jgi:hypothetical protein
MGIYEVNLGVDRAGKDSGRRITMQVRERDPLSAAIIAEELADATLRNPVEYTHAFSSVPIMETVPVSMESSPLAMAA